MSVLDAIVFARFVERQGASDYEPTERDVRGLAQARAEGYTQDQILAAIDEAFDSRKHGCRTDPAFHLLPAHPSFQGTFCSAATTRAERVTRGHPASR